MPFSSSTRRLLQYLSIICIASLWVILLIADQLGTDFYPLHFAARLTLAGDSPYGSEATARLAQSWPAPFASAGIAYPLPLILLITPFALLPFPLASLLWIGVGATGALLCVRITEDHATSILLPLLFLPLYRAVVLGQATLIWFGLAVIMVWATRDHRGWLVGICIMLLALKPQNGLLFALAGMIWSWRTDRRALLWALGAGGVFGGLAFAVQPDWLGAWLAQTRQYQTIVHPPLVLPWGLLVVLACWRLPWWARVAALQVVLFPLSDLYSALPLLLCWIAIGGPLALVGAGCSWLWLIFGLPNNVDVLWGLIFWPLIAAAVWRSWLGKLWPVRRVAPDA